MEQHGFRLIDVGDQFVKFRIEHIHVHGPFDVLVLEFLRDSHIQHNQARIACDQFFGLINRDLFYSELRFFFRLGLVCAELPGESDSKCENAKKRLHG